MDNIELFTADYQIKPPGNLLLEISTKSEIPEIISNQLNDISFWIRNYRQLHSQGKVFEYLNQNGIKYSERILIHHLRKEKI